jgi:hypothetical protein
MEKGEILEDGHPYLLLVNNTSDPSITKQGAFSKLVQNTNDAEKIFEIARKSYFSNISPVKIIL